MGRVPRKTALRGALAIALFGVTLARPSSAEPTCAANGRPWVSLTFSEGPWPTGFADKVLGDLRAGLTNRGIEACADGTGPASVEPLATVQIASVDKKSVA